MGNLGSVNSKYKNGETRRNLKAHAVKMITSSKMNYLDFMAKAKKEALNFGFVGIFQQKMQTKNGSNVLKLERGTWFLFVCVSVVTLSKWMNYTAVIGEFYR